MISIKDSENMSSMSAITVKDLEEVKAILPSIPDGTVVTFKGLYERSFYKKALEGDTCYEYIKREGRGNIADFSPLWEPERVKVEHALKLEDPQDMIVLGRYTIFECQGQYYQVIERRWYNKEEFKALFGITDYDSIGMKRWKILDKMQWDVESLVAITELSSHVVITRALNPRELNLPLRWHEVNTLLFEYL